MRLFNRKFQIPRKCINRENKDQCIIYGNGTKNKIKFHQVTTKA